MIDDNIVIWFFYDFEIMDYIIILKIKEFMCDLCYKELEWLLIFLSIFLNWIYFVKGLGIF